MSMICCLRRKDGYKEIRTDDDDNREDIRVTQMDILNDEIETLRSEARDRSMEMKKIEQRCKGITREKEDALRRLSEVMSLNLRNNNPNIVDLSDEFRPTKLAEMSSELYDNEWTTAYSFLEQRSGTPSDADEKQFIQLLLNILMESYTLANKIHNQEWQGLLKCIYGKDQNPSQENAKQLKDLKKKFALQRLGEIETTCLGHLKHIFLHESSYFENESFRIYVQGCVKLGWLMQIQDPPLVFQCYGWVSKDTEMLDGMAVGNSGTLDTSHDQLLTGQQPTNTSFDKVPRGTNGNLGDMQANFDGTSSDPDAAFKESQPVNTSSGKDVELQPVTTSYVIETETKGGKRSQIGFDKGLYKEYTKKGQFVDFIVWPIMYLHGDGPILSKGVAQGCN